jgi:DNA-binding transcriptional LysR family regulator
MRPTEAGFAILDRSKDLLRDTRDLKAMAGTATISGEMRIGAINTALTGLVPDILHRLAQDYPLIEIFIKPGASMDLYTEVLNGTLDAAFIIEPRFPMQKTVSFNKLRQEPLVLIAPRDCADADPVELLKTRPFIRYDRNQWGGHIADEYLQAIGIRPVERYELDALEAIAVMVNRGLGISIVPDWAPPWPAGLDIVKLPLPHSAATRTVGLVVTRSSPRTNLVATLVQTSRQTVPADLSIRA